MSSSIKDECSICESPLDVEDDLVITECLHTFHRACAQKRVDERKKTDCRICHKDSALDEALRRDPTATNKICSICEEAWYPTEDLVMTSCHHIFHRTCAQKRLDTGKKTDCRICHKNSALGDALRQEISHPTSQQMMPTRSNRFVNSDISEFQQVNRTPIRNYKDVPDMSLEEAVKSIVPFVPHVKDYADRAKERCRNKKPLTINESAAIYLYTMDTPFYPTLNKTLRAENPQALEPWFAFLKLFITAIGKLPSLATTVWRGVADNIHGSDFDEGHEHIWWSINSCSSKVNVAQLFKGPTGTLFCMNTINGKNIAEYSAVQDDDEVVLMPGTCLRIQGTSLEPSGRSIVHFEEW